MTEDYTETLLELEERFQSDEDCLAYLSKFRWPHAMSVDPAPLPTLKGTAVDFLKSIEHKM